MKLSSKISVGPIRRIIFIHKSHCGRIRIVAFPWPPHPTWERDFNFSSFAQGYRQEKHTYHSELKDGTLNTPQWINIPTLLSSYHAGNKRLSKEVQSGVYCWLENGIREQRIPVINIHSTNEYILSIWKKRYRLIPVHLCIQTPNFR